MFSSFYFMISGLTFKFLSRFEFIFVYHVRECSNVIVFHVAAKFFPILLVEETTIFSQLSILASFVVD